MKPGEELISKLLCQFEKAAFPPPQRYFSTIFNCACAKMALFSFYFIHKQGQFVPCMVLDYICCNQVPSVF